MKKTALLILLSLLITACEKEEKPPPNPEWLNSVITQMEDAIPGTAIYLYKWNGEFYYRISNPVSSCLYCTLYNYSGDLLILSAKSTEDFAGNARMIKLIWQKEF